MKKHEMVARLLTHAARKSGRLAGWFEMEASSLLKLRTSLGKIRAAIGPPQPISPDGLVICGGREGEVVQKAGVFPTPCTSSHGAKFSIHMLTPVCYKMALALQAGTGLVAAVEGPDGSVTPSHDIL